MNLNWDSEGQRILHLEPCPTDEPVLGTNERMNQITNIHHLLVALVISLGDVKPSPDISRFGAQTMTFIPLSSAVYLAQVQTPLHELVIMVASAGRDMRRSMTDCLF